MRRLLVSSGFARLVALPVLLFSAAAARGQIASQPIGGNAGGIYIDVDGTVRFREADAAAQLEQVRARARGGQPGKDAKLCYVSLPRLFAQARELAAAGKPLPDEVRYLGGITQLRYVLVDPENKDLLIAGPFEPVDAANPLEPVGKRSGRPVLQLDDLVVSLRTAMQPRRMRAFGCSIDPAPDSLEKSGQVMREYANASRGDRMAAMAKALGPQRVSVFGTAADTRLAFICIAADYKLKRISLGVETAPVLGVGNAMDNTRAAASRVWFEASYEPLLVSADSNAYALRGQRLQLKAGALSFDPKGATEKATVFARQFTQKMPALCAMVPVFADVQNIADLAVLSALIRDDKLAQKASWEIDSLLAPSGYAVATVPVSRTAETLVAFTSGSICAGGVSLSAEPWIAKSARAADAKNELNAMREQRAKLLEKGGSGAVLAAP